MVNLNSGLPEPPDHETDENLSPNNEVILGVDTDTDEDDIYAGYEPLPLNPEEVNESSNSEDDETETESSVRNEPLVPSISTMEETLVKEVWSGPRPETVDIEMDSKKVDEVKQAMSNFVLPPASIPDWANLVPEDEWKEQILARLQNMKQK